MTISDSCPGSLTADLNRLSNASRLSISDDESGAYTFAAARLAMASNTATSACATSAKIASGGQDYPLPTR
jgi:hypothetical protein